MANSNPVFRESEEWPALRKLLERGGERPANRPLLWVGAGTSIMVGYPSTAQLIRELREHAVKRLPEYRPFDGTLPADSPMRSFDRWIETYIKTVGRGELTRSLADIFRKRPLPKDFHRKLVCLPWKAILTTNYDEVLEDALKVNGQEYELSIGEANLEVASSAIQLHKLHGSISDLHRVVFGKGDYDRYRAEYPLAQAKLEIEFLQNPVVFFGCSMTDRRILEWLAKHAERDNLQRRRYSITIMTEADWQSLPSAIRSLLREGQIHPLLLEEHGELDDLVSVLHDEYSTCQPEYFETGARGAQALMNASITTSKDQQELYDNLLYDKVVRSVSQLILSLWLGSKTPVSDDRDYVVQLLRSVGGVRAIRRYNRLTLQVEEEVADLVDSLIRVTAFRLQDAREMEALNGFERKLIVAKSCAEALNGSQVDRALVEELQRQPSMVAQEAIRRASLGVELTRGEGAAIRQIFELAIDLFEALPVWWRSNLYELLDDSRRLLTGLRETIRTWKRSIEDSSRRTYSQVEEAYLRAVAREYDYLELFGIDAPREALRHQLSVAFVQLSLETYIGPETQELPQLISGRSAVLLVGDAGHGKTTLLKWVAVKCARRTADSDQESFARECVPFFIRLREWARRGRLPSHSELAEATLRADLETQELGDWCLKILMEGRGLLLIDGFDEVPLQERDTVKEWIKHLRSKWSNNKIIVSSRSAAAKGRLAHDLQLTEVTILPLGSTTRSLFLEHWHRAAFEASQEKDARRIEKSKKYIARKLKREKQLQKLATNPLMQAVLCALNYRRHGSLPDTKREICENACTLLLSNRDRARGVPEVDSLWARMNEGILESLLGSIALWMMIEGVSVISKKRLVEIIQKRIVFVTTFVGQEINAELLFQLILERTGFLRELISDHFDFTHKIFQEYLAAKILVSEGIKRPLRDNIHHDQWAETIELAVGLMNKIHARYFLQFLLTEAQKLRQVPSSADEGIQATSDPRTARLDLLILRCFNARSELDPDISEDIKNRIRHLIPPPDTSIRRAVVECGDAAVPYLAVSELDFPNSERHWNLPPDRFMDTLRQKLSCALTLAAIETDSSYWQLGDYFHETVPPQAWLNQANQPDGEESASRSEVLTRFTSYVARLQQLASVLDPDLVRISELVERFYEEGNGDIDDTILLDLAFKAGSFLALEGKPMAQSRTDLDLSGSAFTDLASLRVFESLEVLDISGTHVRDLSPLLELRSLTSLDISNTNAYDLQILGRHPSLMVVRAIGVTGTGSLPQDLGINIIDQETFETG